MTDQLGLQFFGGDPESGNVFIVETKAPAGMLLESHVHAHAHTSVLVSGTAEVEVDGVVTQETGYKLITIPANTQHRVQAVTDVIWLCLWSADTAPIEQAKESLKLVNG